VALELAEPVLLVGRDIVVTDSETSRLAQTARVAAVGIDAEAVPGRKLAPVSGRSEVRQHALSSKALGPVPWP